ncbi:MAG: 4-hydroxy-tetrahydrodipicolinate synthase [Clostridia bacterium]|nr:4-hydroxy-tetrahydrodipicolinate synthase [Clostridia bacterium]
MELKGTYTALVTPFKNNKGVDYEALKKLINLQIDSEVSGIVLFGTTGESPTLDAYEKHKILEIAEHLTKDKINLIIGISSNNTEKAINEIKGFSSSSAKAFLVGTPFYNKPTEKGVITHFTKIANQSYKPIILYNVPSRTGTNISLSAIKQLCSHPNIVGIKEAGGNFDYISKLMLMRSSKFAILSGNDNQTLPMMALGATGSISVVSNLVPHEFDLICKYASSGRFAAARTVHELLMPLMNACFEETNPIPIKYMLSKIGIIKNTLRLPLCSLSSKNKKSINKIMSEYFCIGE